MRFCVLRFRLSFFFFCLGWNMVSLTAMDMLQVLSGGVEVDPDQAQMMRLSPISPHQMMTDTEEIDECRTKVRGTLAETFDTSRLQSAFDMLFDIVGHQRTTLERLSRETAVLRKNELDRESELRRLHEELVLTKELAEKKRGIDGDELEALVRRAVSSHHMGDDGADTGAGAGGRGSRGDSLGQTLTGTGGFSSLSLRRQPSGDGSVSQGSDGQGSDEPHPTIRSQRRPEEANHDNTPAIDVAALARQARVASPGCASSVRPHPCSSTDTISPCAAR